MASQRESVDRWLVRRGLSIPEEMVFSDVGSRDQSFKRAGLQRLKEWCREGRVDYVLVDAIDRIGVSDAWELGALVWELRLCGVSIWSCLEGELSRDDLAVPILGGIAASRSKDEQVQRAERTIRAKVSQAERGEWGGGPCPFGWDVLCLGPDRTPKWRVYYVASGRRVKIWPDGRREECNGKGRFPKHDKGDHLKLVPSQDQARVAWLRQVYQWFITESISLRGIAERLNQLGVHPVHGDQWYSARVKELISNPLNACGATVINKRSQGRFLQFSQGELRKVQKIKGRAPGTRRNPECDHVYPKTVHEGLIDQATFDAAQAKLQTLRRLGRKAPRNARLFLAGLVFCGHCQARQAGWTEKDGTLSYTCSSFRKSRANPANCRLHRVRHDVLMDLIKRYLAETGQTIEALLTVESEAGGEVELPVESQDRLDRKQWEYCVLLTKLWRLVKERTPNPPGQVWTAVTLCPAYREAFKEDRVRLSAVLAAKEAELDHVVRNFAKLTTPLAIERASEVIASLEAEIEAIRAELEPADERLTTLRRELEEVRDSLSEAARALAGEPSRRQAELLGRVISRIVCFYRYERAGKLERSILTKVVIEPMSGDVWVRELGGPYPRDGGGSRRS
jgi:hypothetical protein